MINWNNLDTLTSFKELSEVERVNLAEVMSRENGAERVRLQRFDDRGSYLQLRGCKSSR